MAKTKLVAKLKIGENVFWIQTEETTLFKEANVICDGALDCGLRLKYL